ncbi:hypothetical protein KVT40_008492 [Elsinoe batatas]|uniref:Protein kinase domain-containing protein n=1 Tax=Elsinoe batatas TaxID=2601811 RepID=A0A8K0KTA0_9PEZI|nr:hypothetical protein KVT40_008492 [Elsinoe batatas]
MDVAPTSLPIRAPNETPQTSQDSQLFPCRSSPDNDLILPDIGWDDTKMIIAGGSSGRVELLPSGFALKAPYPNPLLKDDNLADIAVEFEIYQILGTHPRLVRVIDYAPDVGLTLEYLPRGNLRAHLLANQARIDQEQRMQWIMDVLDSVELLHSHNVVHGDIKAENFLIDAEGRLRIIDFSGSGLPERPGTAWEGIRHFKPRGENEHSTKRTDIFAVGSTLYEIVTGAQPFAELSDSEVEVEYRQGNFPVTAGLVCGQVIWRCWTGDVESIDHIREAVLRNGPAL